MTQRYGTFDTDGFPNGFYSDLDHTLEEIPEGAVPISHDQWMDFLNNQGARAFRGGEVVPATRPTEPLPLPEDRVGQWVQGHPITGVLLEVIADLTGTTSDAVKASIAQKMATAP